MTYDTVVGRAKVALTSAAAIGLLAIANPAAAATLVQYNFNGDPGNQTTEVASFVAANLSGINFSRGSGLNAPSGGDSFSSSGWGNYATNANDYLSFGLTVMSGFSANVNQLVFSSRSSNTGPGNLAVLAAIDGGAFTQIATFNQSGDSVANRVLNFAPLTGFSNVVFRIVANSSTAANGTPLATGGTFRVQNYAGTPNNPFSINGDVTAIAAAVPEPASWAMMILGMGAVGFAMRRRMKVSKVNFTNKLRAIAAS
jgi:hypothetical protein